MEKQWRSVKSGFQNVQVQDTASLHGMGGQYGMGKKFLLTF